MSDTELKCKILGVITVSLPDSDLRQTLILSLIREYKADLICRLMGERAVVNGRELNREEAYIHFRSLSPQDLESLIDDCGLIFH